MWDAEPLQAQHALAAPRQLIAGGAAHGPHADHDHVVAVGVHAYLTSRPWAPLAPPGRWQAGAAHRPVAWHADGRFVDRRTASPRPVPGLNGHQTSRSPGGPARNARCRGTPWLTLSLPNALWRCW